MVYTIFFNNSKHSWFKKKCLIIFLSQKQLDPDKNDRTDCDKGEK